MKRMRKFQIMKQVLLKKHQRKMIRLFRKNVVNDKMFLYEAQPFNDDDMNYCIEKLSKGAKETLTDERDFRILTGLVEM